MPKEKKSIKIRDQKPQKDVHGGMNKHLNTVGTERNKNNRGARLNRR